MDLAQEVERVARDGGGGGGARGGGEVIICQEPYASTPNRISVGSSCDHCFASGNLRKCSKEEWKLHQLECQAISALTEERKKMLTPTIRLMVKLILRRKLQSEKMANLVQLILPSIELDLKEIAHTFSKFGSFSNEEYRNTRASNTQYFELDLKEIAHTFSKILAVIGSLRPNPLGLGSAVIAVQPTQVQFTCNAHTICDPELRPLGTGLFPAISIINHSCVPNAVLLFEGRTAYVRALQPLSSNTEVSISYIETAATTLKRHNDLKQYFFTCTCTRCIKDSEEDALLEGYRCKDQKCDGFLLPDSGKKAYACQKCSISRDEEEIYMELQDWQTALMYCRMTIPVYERFEFYQIIF
ncbi:unnamed protein product [Triticum turgidum subsp. durum]|uniref:SET domain-containing protein n=1 Tax=Triticum turgidum subsp. durum TaxID=4567 RepID=A0A9R0SI84_TRITD|nr:unnamed protein product [Triticum turgidum subsp. durum]